MRLKIFKKFLYVLVLLYMSLFAARFGYDLVTFTDADITDNYNVYYPAESYDRKVSNIASQKMEFVLDGPATPAVMEQKYERISNMTAKSVNYDDDMARLNASIENHRAVIQKENRRGLSGSRRADLTIGVRPESFDAMLDEISRIGSIISTNVTTADKTYEYRQMLAEKEILERRRTSYEELRKHGGSISELLQLEERIIGVEAEILQQMIGLGEYSDEYALCTINYSIYEGTEAGLSRKFWNALTWSTTTYMIIIGIAMFTALAALVLMWCWHNIKKLLADKPETQWSAFDNNAAQIYNPPQPDNNPPQPQNKAGQPDGP